MCELALQELFLPLGEFLHGSLEVAVVCLVLRHHLLRVRSHLHLHVAEPLHQLEISCFFTLQFLGE